MGDLLVIVAMVLALLMTGAILVNATLPQILFVLGVVALTGALESGLAK